MTIQNLLKVELPIIQAPMAGVQDWQLAFAVSEAGGLGSIPCGMLSTEQVVEQIQAFASHSDKPYNLNFFCHQMPPLDQAKMSAWEEVLSNYYQDFGLKPSAEIGVLRRPFDFDMADAIAPFKPPAISFHFGLPSAELVSRIKSWGTRILSTATTVEEGIWLQEHGADIVIAQGFEAGGHRGMFLTQDISTQVNTSELLHGLIRRVSIPVIVAGGIATPQDAREVTELGAQGVQVGTAYLLCDEAKTSGVHRQALVSQNSTMVTNLFSGRPARGIRNRLMQDLGPINGLAPAFPYASIALASLRKHCESVGLSDFSPMWAGEKFSQAKSGAAATITRELGKAVLG